MAEGKAGDPGAEWQAQASRWTDAHSEEAVAEGWDLFDVDCTGLLQVQRVDDPGADDAADEPRAPVFGDDAAALGHVEGKARAGSATHRLASELHGYFAPLVGRTECPGTATA